MIYYLKYKVFFVVASVVIQGNDYRIISQGIETPGVEEQGQEKSPFKKENDKTQR